MGKILHDDRNGYRYESNKGILYDLLEGVSLKGSTTSDIVFITLYQGEEVDEDFLEYIWNNDYETYVGYFMGAELVDDIMYKRYHFGDEDEESLLETLEYFTSIYESKYNYVLKKYKKRGVNEYVVGIEKYGKVTVKAKNEQEAIRIAKRINNEDEIEWDDEFVPTAIIDEGDN